MKLKNRTVIIYRGRICGKEMSSDADGRLVKTGMIVYLEGEFRVMAAATGNDRRLTVDSRKDGTCSWYDVNDGKVGDMNQLV